MREPLQHENNVTINHQVFADGFYMGSSHVIPSKNPQPPIGYCSYLVFMEFLVKNPSTHVFDGKFG